MKKAINAHKTLKVVGERITRLQVRRSPHDYKGTAGDKTILYHDCACGEKHAFEYGSTEHMREVYKAIMARRAAA